ncbi:YkgJ family cysteine cluster protein [Marinomonas sp. 15G1-11]|uniref:YkgJ family cysteine cluster protein n=1 Tax=Marinomonas phaeophyticola TaxID=3004091 RepID=A0ABT4JY78_9GAMM|nr:YkgJ family cysteine cluster protein [Marinomonas sp. 15G1-11]MCZ2723017.1 YkgJ family cysteine cluster protein [Marinomonas sp. 15G1-11]
MECRSNCGACCISPSITSFIPGMPNGKPAGVKCIHLLENMNCALFNSESRPKVCFDFNAHLETCGSNKEEAILLLTTMEKFTQC